MRRQFSLSSGFSNFLPRISDHETFDVSERARPHPGQANFEFACPFLEWQAHAFKFCFMQGLLFGKCSGAL